MKENCIGKIVFVWVSEIFQKREAKKRRDQDFPPFFYASVGEGGVYECVCMFVSVNLCSFMILLHDCFKAKEETK